MKKLILSITLIYTSIFGNLFAGENVILTNMANYAFAPFAIPIPVRLDLLGQFNQNVPFISPEINAAYDTIFYPTFLITSNSDKKIYSLSKVEVLDGNNTLVLSNEEDGYIYIKRSEIEIGFGIKGALNVGPGISGGLAPYFGKGKVETRIVPFKDKKNLKKLEDLQVPINKEIFDSWKIGEKLSYYKKGGIQFTAFAGYAVAGVGIGLAAEGTWKVIMQKVSKDKLVAHMRKVKLVSLKLGVSTLTPSAKVTKYWKFDDDFSFIFDFEKDDAIDTFKAMLKGRMKTVQELARDMQVESVELVTRETGKISGQNFAASFTLPGIFSTKFILSEESEFTVTDYFKEDLKIELNSGENSRFARTSGIASKNYTRYMFFNSNVAQIKQLNSGDDLRTVSWAHFHYQFQRDKFNKKYLAKEVNKLFKLVGHYDQIKLNAPDQELFGHVKLQLDYVISNPGTKKLLDNVQGIDRDTFVSMGPRLVSNFFTTNLNIKKVCGKRLKVSFCKKVKLVQTKVYLKRGYNYLQKMKVAWKNKNYKKYTKYFSRFGRNLTKNMFTFEVLTNLVGKENIKMFLSVQGDELARYQKEIIL